MGEHCATCVCGRRAVVQAEADKPAGTIAWTEHEEAWAIYAAKYGRGQSAERIHERGGFGYRELTKLLSRPPATWAPTGPAPRCWRCAARH